MREVNSSFLIIERTVTVSINETAKSHTVLLAPDYGGMENFRNYLQLFLPYTFLSSLGFLIGICGKRTIWKKKIEKWKNICFWMFSIFIWKRKGNGLIIGSILMSKELRRNATCILVLNLALGDLLISLVVNSFAVVGKKHYTLPMHSSLFVTKNWALCLLFYYQCDDCMSWHEGVMAGKKFFDHHMFLCEIVGALCLIGTDWCIFIDFQTWVH